MQISLLRQDATEAALAFAWDQWAQMGVLAAPTRIDTWAIDPEALIVFSLDVARHDPRLFDEILDWLVVNERLVSVQRLRNLAAGQDATALIDAALSWVSRTKPRRRLSREPSTADAASSLAPLFVELPMRDAVIDEAFAAHGFARPPAVASGKSRPPDPHAPVNLAFWLRHLLGVSVRAEVMRCLLTIEAPRVSAQAITMSAGYSTRNVQEALHSLAAAGVISSMTLRGDRRYAVDRAMWSPLLRYSDGVWPSHRDWPQLLASIRRILRWLNDPETEKLSPYMRTSRARDVLEDIGDDLLFAGVAVETPPPGAGQEAWDSFVATVQRAVGALGARR